jgi:hypothetical protein
VAKRDYDWYCQEEGCDFHTDKYAPYVAFWTDRNGRRHRDYTARGTVVEHQDSKGHTKYRRKVAPGV